MTFNEIQSYVTQVCEVLEANKPQDAHLIAAPLEDLVNIAARIADTLEKIATALEAASEKS